MLYKLIISAVAIMAFSCVQAAPNALRQTEASCSISLKEFDTWFASGTLSNNGAVNAANSVNFPTDNTACDFYKWAHQMFLWITSPATEGIVLDSPTFYDVNFGKNGNAVFIPNGSGAAGNSFVLRGTLPERIQPGGQAGGNDTLLSLNGSLVYFGVHANDVFAWFNTAVTNGALPAQSPFPTTRQELTPIVVYAAQNGSTLSDANALTMELKSAWIDAATVANVADYVTIEAAVPNYVKTSSSLWTVDAKNPTVVKTLALVGLHVVGPVAGHPEMVWSTFEHRNNAPDNDFYFNILGSKTIPVPYNSTGTWNFMSNGGTRDGALIPQMKVDSETGNIVAIKGKTIQANNVYRANPWGNAPTISSAANNSQLISLNLDVDLMLALVGDVRANYLQIGAVWTRNGSIPPSPTDPELTGSLLLANSTMETYHQQGTSESDQGCFGCHYASSSTGTSHLFSTKNHPLVPAPKK